LEGEGLALIIEYIAYKYCVTIKAIREWYGTEEVK
jgi:hypothetical protein